MYFVLWLCTYYTEQFSSKANKGYKVTSNVINKNRRFEWFLMLRCEFAREKDLHGTNIIAGCMYDCDCSLWTLCVPLNWLDLNWTYIYGRETNRIIFLFIIVIFIRCKDRKLERALSLPCHVIMFPGKLLYFLKAFLDAKVVANWKICLKAFFFSFCKRKKCIFSFSFCLHVFNNMGCCEKQRLVVLFCVSKVVMVAVHVGGGG